MSQEIDEIKSKIDIVDLIGGYIKVIPAGANFKALCPFHNEKTPSFMINQDKQIWRCFGCGEGGDIFSFLTKIESLEFPEALKVLAQKAGVTLKHTNVKHETGKNRLYSLMDLTSRYWQKVLQESSTAESVREYVKGRGLDPEIVEDFKLGYSIDSWDNLFNFLKKRGYTDQEIFLAGLSVKKTKGVGYYDRFRNRLMFPILDLSGKTIGFGGRALKKDEMAKYINSPQTLIYNKSLVLYGLYQAKDQIKKDDQCILVEGYMDILPSHQAGVKNVVAISGTALTLQQIKILKRYTNNLVLSLDMDEAGRQAALRSIEVALGEEMNIKVASLPQGKDPGECATNSPEDWKRAIKDAKPVMEYYFDQAVKDRNVNDPKDKKDIVRGLSEKISRLGSKVEQDHWLKLLAQKLSTSESVLREEIVRISSQTRNNGYNVNTVDKIKLSDRVVDKDLTIFKNILSIIFAYPQKMGDMIEKMPLEYLQNEVAVSVYKKLVLFYNKNKDLFNKSSVDNEKQPDLFDSLGNAIKEDNLSLKEEAEDLLSESFLLSQNNFSELEEPEVRAELYLLIKTLKRDYSLRQMEELKKRLEEAERESNQEAIKKISQALNDLIKKKNF